MKNADNISMKSFVERVYANVANLTGKVAVAVSGGMDSMCLLSVLYSMPDRKFDLAVVNVEHGIRGEESKKDSLFVENYAKKMGLDCFEARVDAPEYARKNKVSLETAGRILRYDFFEKILAKKTADYICLAHHADDLCETVLMRIFRGTGLDGLKGIQSRDRFIRPLLDSTRKDIENYVRENGVSYRTDESNFENDYARNFLRNETLPSVEKKWPDYRTSILKLAARAKENEEFLTRIAPKFQKDGDAIYLKIDELKNVDTVLQKCAVRKAVRALNGGVDFEEKNLYDVLSFYDAKNGSRLDLADGIKVWKEYDKIVFERYDDAEIETIPFKIGSFLVGNSTWIVCQRKDEIVRFDLAKIPSDAVIRARRDGDKFVRFGGISSSLGDFYTDKKIPKRLRDRYPVIAVGSDVLVTPVEIADSVRVDDGKDINSFVLKKID